MFLDRYIYPKYPKFVKNKAKSYFAYDYSKEAVFSFCTQKKLAWMTQGWRSMAAEGLN